MTQYDTEGVTLRGFNTVRVSKDALINRIKDNRDKHRTIYEEAMEGWKRTVIQELERAYDQALKGERFLNRVFVPRPEDHTDEYDTVIELLEMSLDEELELTQQEFANYVLDKWRWRDAFLTTASNYGVGQFRAPDAAPPVYSSSE